MKKNLMNYLSFCLLILGATQMSAQYCTTGGPSSTLDSSVDSIGLTGDAATLINYQKVCGATGLEDFTATQSASVTAGNNYDVTVVFGSCGTTAYIGSGEVWIDWNQNDVFDAYESIGTWSNLNIPSDTMVYSFNVPTSAFNGSTRMRVMHQEGSVGVAPTLPLDPCASYSWGSLADFSIVISGGATITCPDPSTLTVANTTATSSDLAWTENGTATSWIVEYGSTNFTLGSGTSVIASTNPFNLTGLMPSTAYDFYVRAVCGPGDSSLFEGPFNFRTPCTPEVAPWFDDIEAHTATTSLGLSNCWTTSSNSTFDWNIDGSGSTPSTGTGPTGAFSGSNYFYVEASNGTVGDTAELISPLVDMTPLAAPVLEFYYHMFGDQQGVMSDLYIDIYDGATWNTVDSLIGEQQTTQADPWLKRTVDLAAFSGTVQVRFRAIKNGAQYGDISLDDIAIKEAPSCFDPTNLVATNITATTADLGWTENGTATNWQVEYGAQGFVQGTGTSVFTGTNPLSITNLTANTSYGFYIRAVCAPGDTSAWAGPFTFGTPCAVFTPAYLTDFSTFVPTCWELGNGGTPASGATNLGSSDWIQDGSSAYINLYTTGASDWLISPEFDLSAGPWELVINANATDYLTPSAFSGMGSDDTIQVVVSTNGGTTWTPIYTWDVNNTPALIGTDLVLSLSAYTGASNLFAIWTSEGVVDDSEDYDVFINTFEIRAIPTPNLVITEIMYNSPEAGTDSLEFVEIYNNGTTAADLTNYTLSGISYTFPAVSLPAGGYYVIGVNASAFNTVYGFAADGIATGGLANGGEAVIIRDAAGVVVDSVDYDDAAPWPSGSGAGLPDGGGSSLVLCDTASDNADGANWNACVTSTGVTINGFDVLASPGAANFCPAPLDVAVTSFYNLDSVYCNVGTITGSVIITNVSTTDATNVPYTITANGTPLGGGTITLLAGNASDTITVGPFPAATGIANIVVMTSLTGDVNASNDMLSTTVYVSNTNATASVMTTITCNGDSTGAVMAVAAGGIGTYTYMWNADANLTTANLMNIPAGMNTVVVMDSVGCTDTAMVTLTEPTAIVLTDSVDNVLCNGDSTGMAMVMATGGTGAFSFAWSNGATTDMNMNVPAGSYTVTVTDANACMEMLTATVVEPTALDVTITDNGNGTAYATATGGTAGYSFLWDAAAGSQTTDTVTALINNGTYVVTVTDANGCTDTASVVINFNSVNSIANLSSLNLFPNPTNANVFVELELVENADVQINITNSIGQLVISKELTNVQSETVELNTSTLTSGVYMVQFTIGTELVTRKLIVSKQ